MGCCNDKTLKSVTRNSQLINSPEEDCIVSNEKLLRFTNVSISKVITQIKKYENQGILSPVLLKGAFNDLDFEENTFSDPESPDFKFIQQLQNPKKIFDVTTVVLSGILLGSANKKDKATYLFKLYDKLETCKLMRSEISEMLKEIMDLAVKKIPLIVVDDSEEPAKNTLSTEQVQKHISSLEENVERFTNRLMNRLLESNSSITMDKFIEKLCDDPILESILWSYQIRLMLLE